MANIKKLYKQLKRYDVDDSVEYDESTDKVEVYSDHMSAEAVEEDNNIEININYMEDDYAYMPENNPMIDKSKNAFGIMAGVLDGCLLPEISEDDDRLLYLKRNPDMKIKRMITGGSILSMIFGILSLFLGTAVIFVLVVMHSNGKLSNAGVIALMSFVVLLLIILGVLLIRNSIRLTEVTYTTYLFLRVDRLPDEAKIKRILQAVCEKTRTDAIEVKLDLDGIPTLFSSKIGGVPYWDLSKPYPTNSSGEKMVMLAQFNLAELPENNKLPKKGMLQFFVVPDASFGRYFDGSTDGHKVVYHSKVDRNLTEAQVWDLGISTSLETECFPVSGEFAVNFSKVRVYMSPEDVRISDVVKDAANRMGIYSETYNAFDIFSDEQLEMLREHGVSHGLFGYPCFIQWDPRGDAEAKKYDTLLFQLSSECNNTNSEIYPGRKLMWGDAGACQFFINEFALSKLDFSDVLYSWEC